MLLWLGEYGCFIDVVEPPSKLSRQLQMGQLILSHGNKIGLVQEDVGGLQDGVAEKAVGCEIFLFDLFLFFLIGRVALKPRSEPSQQEVED